jgi:hypothetical protein
MDTQEAAQRWADVWERDRAAVPWSAQTRLANGGTEDLAGVSLLRFGADGLVVAERDFSAEG